MIITHCVDDVCNIEIKETVLSARAAFIELCELLGLRLDPEKSLLPSFDFIYLGLRLILPAVRPHRIFSFSVPEPRRLRLRDRIFEILTKGSLTPAEASSMRGRLYFYAFWMHFFVLLDRFGTFFRLLRRFCVGCATFRPKWSRKTL